jgi:hypothetical protein
MYILPSQTKGRKQKRRRFSLIRLPFAHPGKWKFVVYTFTVDETNGSYPFANKLNGLMGLAHLWP